MTLEVIDVPEEIDQLPHSAEATNLISIADDRIEAFTSANDWVTENFVPCDFYLVDQALTWIEQNHLLTGDRFCELGSGFGVVTMLAALRNMEAVGIEIESYLVDQASGLADELEIEAEFHGGSFVPRGISSIIELETEAERVVTDEGDVFEEIDFDFDDFDLFFAFPWPGESHFFEGVFEAAAADNALLLMYDGRNGMKLVRKI